MKARRHPFDGKNLTLREWSKKLGIDVNLLRCRYSRGLRGEALFRKARIKTSTKYLKIEYKGCSKSLAGWAEELSIPYITLWKRYKDGLTPPELFVENRITQKRINEGIQVYQLIMRSRGRDLKTERIHAYKKLNEDYKSARHLQVA